jgi:hypothetical protein
MAAKQTQCDPMFTNMLEYLLRVPNDEMKAGVRMVTAESGKDPRHKMGRTSCAGGEPHNPAEFLSLAYLVKNLFKLSKDMLKSFSQADPARGQSHAMDRANEERGIQIGFQPTNLPGNSRLGKMKSSSCSGDLAGVGNGQEGLQQTRV